MNRFPLHCVCCLCLLRFGLFQQAEASADREGCDPVPVTARNAYQDSLRENEFLTKIFKKYGKGGKMTFGGFQELLDRLLLGEVRIVHHEEIQAVDLKEDRNTSATLVLDTIGDTDHVHYPHRDSHHDRDDQHEESGIGHQDSDHSGHSHQDSHESATPQGDVNHHKGTTEIINQVPQNTTTTAATAPAALQEDPSPRPGRHGGSRGQRRQGKRGQRRGGRKSTAMAVPTSSSLDLMQITTESLRRVPRDAGNHTGKEEEEHHDDGHDHDDHGHNDHDHHEREPGAHCLSAREILVQYKIPSGPSPMTMPDFVNICPLLITQIDEQACIVHEGDGRDDGEHGEHKGKEALPAAVWGYGILAIATISILSALGIVLLPLMEKRVYQFLLCFLVAMAVGTLTGDAVLHLLPHAFGFHADKDSQEEGDDEGSHLDPLLKGLTVLFGIYFLFIMEKLLHGVMTKRRAKRKAKKLQKQKELADLEESCKLEVSADSTKEDDNCPHHHHHHHDNNKLKDAGIATMAWMVIMGDGVHNLSDGLAIGAAFAGGITGGISTSIAIFCHELPQELGDFALLIKAGMSVKQAVMYNMMSTCICYIGLFIGLGIGNLSGKVIQYVFAVTAGMFLYIGLVDMLPDMVHPNQPQAIAEHDHGEHGNSHGHSHGHNGFSHDNNLKEEKKNREPTSPVHVLMQLFGLLGGIGIMLLIAVYEHQIKI
ncbi:zinc transporter ZIP10-like [Branchiostoma lanceolatum]|uniref:zinc transporter ZIP10-like n=1 Tax=Branchiostoma lanceolatum TaxID=7740 RepID=UPI003453DDD2